MSRWGDTLMSDIGIKVTKKVSQNTRIWHSKYQGSAQLYELAVYREGYRRGLNITHLTGRRDGH